MGDYTPYNRKGNKTYPQYKKQSIRYTPNRITKSECLILQHQHQKDRQANNKNERRYTNQQKI